ncbi:thermonuclease family protein [Mycoplasma zalophidermidis]|uniref:Thermonuclease family protein n=1 Tax=Mycoplasma zalophidermidis TaxID=398174 RepID=A0ABS6DQX1_9MOLU|nr:thermonuclease family protein [Mycoplasma zalophidermidis]MBU4689525.1 thermonuclease family protein [Mycoplasma zalophidermidis]MBU4693403.1 thermonuclease family protein [Mycoplasma zalophidermidis]MCR8966299.1 thermonuclease family protein [Mycoplasma zalophidermidis]
MKWLKLIPLLSIPLSTLACTMNFSQYSNYKLNSYYVADGDTIYAYIDNVKVGIRFYGIDTPETKKSNNSVADLENFFAQKAKVEVIKLLNKKPIKIVKITEDKYKRWICKVFNHNDKDIALNLLKSGLARVKYISKNRKNINYWTNDYENIQYLNELKKSENLAKTTKKGLWFYGERRVFYKK